MLGECTNGGISQPFVHLVETLLLSGGSEEGDFLAGALAARVAVHLGIQGFVALDLTHQSRRLGQRVLQQVLQHLIGFFSCFPPSHYLISY